MRSVGRRIGALGLALAICASAFAGDYTRGEVTRIDARQKKLTIRHDAIDNLGMPAMKMVFAVADETLIDKVVEGQKIEFIAERINGRLTVTHIR